MEAVSASMYLGGIASRESVLCVSRVLATRIGSKLAEQCLVWQRITLRLGMEAGEVIASRQFPRAQNPQNLGLHLEGIIATLKCASPVERISVTVDWLSSAPIRQLTLFDGKDSEKEDRLNKVVQTVGRMYNAGIVRASELGVSRREQMLAFYDPWRQRMARVS